MSKRETKIGDILRRARKRKKMLADEVAARCNVTRSRYYQWEASNRILNKNLPALAATLDLSIDYLRRVNG